MEKRNFLTENQQQQRLDDVISPVDTLLQSKELLVSQKNDLVTILRSDPNRNEIARLAKVARKKEKGILGKIQHGILGKKKESIEIVSTIDDNDRNDRAEKRKVLLGMNQEIDGINHDLAIKKMSDLIEYQQTIIEKNGWEENENLPNSERDFLERKEFNTHSIKIILECLNIKGGSTILVEHLKSLKIFYMKYPRLSSFNKMPHYNDESINENIKNQINEIIRSGISSTNITFLNECLNVLTYLYEAEENLIGYGSLLKGAYDKCSPNEKGILRNTYKNLIMPHLIEKRRMKKEEYEKLYYNSIHGKAPNRRPFYGNTKDFRKACKDEYFLSKGYYNRMIYKNIPKDLITLYNEEENNFFENKRQIQSNLDQNIFEGNVLLTSATAKAKFGEKLPKYIQNLGNNMAYKQYITKYDDEDLSDSDVRDAFKNPQSEFRTACMVAYLQNDVSTIEYIENLVIKALRTKHRDGTNSKGFIQSCLDIENNTLAKELNLSKASQGPARTTIKDFIKSREGFL